MSTKPSTSHAISIAILIIILASIGLVHQTTALPTGYEFGELGCSINAGMAIPNVRIHSNLEASGDFIARYNKVQYTGTDQQEVAIGYTSSDASNGRYHLLYDLDQNYSEGTPNINAYHLMETSGSTISSESAGIAYRSISENASNADTPTSARVTSSYTSMMTQDSTYAAETTISNSLAAEGQPTTLSMTAQTSGLKDNIYSKQGATFWKQTASYDHRLADNSFTQTDPRTVTGNESMDYYEIGMTGGKHAVNYNFKSNIASRVSAIVFEPEGETSSSLQTPLTSDTSSPTTTTDVPIEITPEPTDVSTITEPVGFNITNLTSNNITSNSTLTLDPDTGEYIDMTSLSKADYNSYIINN